MPHTGGHCRPVSWIRTSAGADQAAKSPKTPDSRNEARFHQELYFYIVMHRNTMKIHGNTASESRGNFARRPWRCQKHPIPETKPNSARGVHRHCHRPRILNRSWTSEDRRSRSPAGNPDWRWCEAAAKTPKPRIPETKPDSSRIVFLHREHRNTMKLHGNAASERPDWRRCEACRGDAENSGFRNKAKFRQGVSIGVVTAAEY